MLEQPSAAEFAVASRGPSSARQPDDGQQGAYTDHLTQIPGHARAHVADGFPSGLAPDEAAVALYVLPADAAGGGEEFKDERACGGLAPTMRNQSV